MALKPIKVSQLNSYIKRLLSTDPILNGVSVIGEISNLKFHGTGNIYFTLKDETSKISCFLGAELADKLKHGLSDGMEAILTGYIYLYEKGGTYSINVRSMEIQGAGNLNEVFEALKSKLAKEGLFDEVYKKPIPSFPRKVAIVTSETGAAVQDILKIIKKRNSYVDILIYPALVQGAYAAADIASAIDDINEQFPEIDTMIVGRGGGSAEELWAFNEEIVARSIFASKIPIISSVGHETDFTIADFVADKRAETPTAAAVLAVPDTEELKKRVNIAKERLYVTASRYIKYKELQIVSKNANNLQNTLLNRIAMYKLKTDRLRDKLEALNPTAVIDRGYAAILDHKGIMQTSAKKFIVGEEFIAVFSDGQIRGKVINKEVDLDEKEGTYI